MNWLRNRTFNLTLRTACRSSITFSSIYSGSCQACLGLKESLTRISQLTIERLQYIFLMKTISSPSRAYCSTRPGESDRSCDPSHNPSLALLSTVSARLLCISPIIVSPQCCIFFVTYVIVIIIIHLFDFMNTSKFALSC